MAIQHECESGLLTGRFRDPQWCAICSPKAWQGFSLPSSAALSGSHAAEKKLYKAGRARGALQERKVGNSQSRGSRGKLGGKASLTVLISP